MHLLALNEAPLGPARKAFVPPLSFGQLNVQGLHDPRPTRTLNAKLNFLNKQKRLNESAAQSCWLQTTILFRCIRAYFRLRVLQICRFPTGGSPRCGAWGCEAWAVASVGLARGFTKTLNQISLPENESNIVCLPSERFTSNTYLRCG